VLRCVRESFDLSFGSWFLWGVEEDGGGGCGG